jgi:hypothetical protein
MRKSLPILAFAFLVTVSACSSNPPGAARPSSSRTSSPPSEHTYVAKDGSWRLRYPSPWYVEHGSADYLSLFNTKLSPAELAAREKAEDYSIHDGEAKIEVYVGEKVDLASAKREECRAHETTLAVHECKVIRVANRDALWILSDHSNDGDCTCRYMVINGSRVGLRLGGGGCIKCSQTRRILQEIEAILLTLELR